MFGQSLLSGAFGSALDPGLYFNNKLYDGTGTAQSIGGKIKGAGSFNGSSSYITLPNFASDVLQNNFSWSFWLKPSNITNKELGGSYTYSSGTGVGWSIGFWSSLRLGWVTQSNTWNTLSNSTTLSAGTWYHIVVTKNTTSANIYVNGSDSNTASASGDFSIKTTDGNDIENDFWYGAVDSGGMNYFMSGELDQSRFYTGILSASNITALYNETADTASTLDFPAGAGCVTGYTFDANADTIAPIPNSTTGVTTCDFPTGAGGQLLYQFEDNANDTCGTYNATAGSNITYASGLFSNAAKFTATTDSASDAITVPDSVASLVVNDFTVSFWMNADYLTDTGSLNEVNPFAFQKGRRYFVSFLSTGVLQTYNGSSMLQSSTGIINQTGFWYNIVMSQSSTTGRALYVNSALVASDSSTSDNASYNPGGSENIIGGYKSSSAWGLMFRGLIDQFRIFNTALTQSQVTQLARGAEYNGLSSNVTYLGFLNFQPGFTWIKRTSSTEPHALYDSIRGPNEQLSSDSTLAQATNSAQYPGLTSFDPYGFSLGNNGGVNSSSQSYVSWNWKAGDTSAAVFNGSSSVIILPQSTVFDLNGAGSFSLWVNRNDTTRRWIFEKANGGSGTYGWQMEFGGTDYRFQMHDTSNNVITAVTGTSGLAINTWEHIVVTSSASKTYKIYFNGNLRDTQTLSGTVSVNTNGARLGEYSLAAGYSFSGEMDQVRFFNTELTQTQITDLYGETASNNDTLNFPAGAGCTAAYTLNSTVADVGGNYNATPTAITYAKPGYTGVNNDGSVASQVSANQDAGFSMVKYTGVQPGSGNVSTIGHGLKNPPELIITKVVNSTNGWPTLYYKGSDKFCVRLNTTAGSDANNLSLMFGNGTNAVAPTSSVYTVGNSDETNYAYDYIAYAWHSIPKYSKIGTYVGNGNTTGPTVNTGFEPAWILFKRTDATNGWSIIDSARSTSNPRTSVLQPMNTDQEYTSNSYAVDFLSDGFQIKNSDNGWNTSGGTYIYMAFAVPLT